MVDNFLKTSSLAVCKGILTTKKGRSSQYAENARVLTNDVWLETSRGKDTKLSRNGKFAEFTEMSFKTSFVVISPIIAPMW